jgi:hypothetical protein
VKKRRFDKSAAGAQAMPIRHGRPTPQASVCGFQAVRVVWGGAWGADMLRNVFSGQPVVIRTWRIRHEPTGKRSIRSTVVVRATNFTGSTSELQSLPPSSDMKNRGRSGQVRFCLAIPDKKRKDDAVSILSDFFVAGGHFGQGREIWKHA